MPEHKDEHILKDEIIQLNSVKAEKTGIDKHQLRLVHVYKEDENKVIAIITNQLDWEYNTIAELYKKRWDIELFFKSLKICVFLITKSHPILTQFPYLFVIKNFN